MKRMLSVGSVVLIMLFFTTQVCAHWRGGGGRVGGFHGSFGHPGFQGFRHFDHFQHEPFFGPQHPFGPHHHGSGFHNGFLFQDRSSFFGRPFFPRSPSVVVIHSPFFCFPDGLEFTDQALFFDHLHQVHGIPFVQAGSFCRQLLGGRLIFFGF